MATIARSNETPGDLGETRRRCTEHPDRPAVVEVAFHELRRQDRRPGHGPVEVRRLCAGCAGELARAWVLFGTRAA